MEECESVRKRLIHFPSEKREVLSPLKLSYDHLSVHLKRCLAYCLIFPPEYEFEKEKLVHLWMAEGFLQLPGESRSMEEVGDEYFRELLLRSFLQRSNGNKSRFMMQDLMSYLATLVSGKFCFRLEYDDTSGMNAWTRHLSLFRRKYDCPMIFEAIDKAKFIITCLSLDHESSHFSSIKLQNLLSKLQFLRVLSLSHYHITELPVSINKLKHLRYMNLSHTAIKILPETVCALYNLQTLILSNCHYLTKLPKNMWKLINLRHLDIIGTNLNEMPKEMSRLGSLQTLLTLLSAKKVAQQSKSWGGFYIFMEHFKFRSCKTWSLQKMQLRQAW